MADQEDQSSKTEEPTERKLRKAREQGNVPKSREVNNLFALIGVALTLFITLPMFLESLLNLIGMSISGAGQWRADTLTGAGRVMEDFGIRALIALFPLLILLLIFGLLGGLAQNGLVFSTKPVEPKLDKISPIKGIQRMFSLKALAEFLKTLLKLALIGAALVFVFRAHWDVMLTLPQQTPFQLVVTVQIIFSRLVFAAIAIMAILAIADFMFQRQQFTEEQKMTRREIKDEMKESEGDPHIKARQAQIRRERAQSRMMAEVPKADVVITNPTHFAVALKYDADGGQAAPIVTAKGADFLAFKIRELAAEHDVPLYEDPPLARQLYKDVEIDDMIPLSLYEATAQVIAYVLNLKKKKAS